MIFVRNFPAFNCKTLLNLVKGKFEYSVKKTFVKQQIVGETRKLLKRPQEILTKRTSCQFLGLNCILATNCLIKKIQHKHFNMVTAEEAVKYLEIPDKSENDKKIYKFVLHFNLCA